MEQLRSIIQKKYTLVRELYAWRGEVQRLESLLLRKTGQVRRALAAQQAYRRGLRQMLDRLSGQFREKSQTFAAQVRQAQAEEETCRQELEAARLALGDLERIEREQPSREELFARYPDSGYLQQQDALLNCERLIRLLRENERYLLEAQSREEEIRRAVPAVLDQGADCARQIFLLLSQINELGFGLEIHAYFQNPDKYFAGAAEHRSRQERIGYALRGIQLTRSVLQELQLQLAE